MSEDKKSGGQENRKSKRGDASFAVFYSIKAPFEEHLNFGEKELGATAFDLSEGGVCLLTDYPILIGTGIILKFRLLSKASLGEEERARNFEVQGEACYCVRSKVRAYRIGIRFMGLTPDERAFIAKSI